MEPYQPFTKIFEKKVSDSEIQENDKDELKKRTSSGSLVKGPELGEDVDKPLLSPT